MAGPCVADTNCIALSLDGSNQLIAQPILSPDLRNGLVCLANGLYVETTVQDQEVSTASPVVVSNITTVSGAIAAQTATLTLTNPSATKTARYMAFFDCGSTDLHNIEPRCIMSVATLKRVVPAVFVLTRRFTTSNTSAVYNSRGEDGSVCIPFSGSLAGGSSVTLEIFRFGKMESAPSSLLTGDLTMGDIQAHGWVIA